jgi:hypothetical protein
MKGALLAFALLLVCVISAHSQQIPCIDAGSTLDDTVYQSLTIPGGIFGLSRSGLSPLSSGGLILSWEFISERTSSGQHNYVISIPSISYSGDCSGVDGMTASQILDLIAKATVSRGVALGYTPCPASCAVPTLAKVSQPACVKRTGSGCATHFSACVPIECCVRFYSVCCPNGTTSPQITLLGSQSGGCSGLEGCEATCP